MTKVDKVVEVSLSFINRHDMSLHQDGTNNYREKEVLSGWTCILGLPSIIFGGCLDSGEDFGQTCFESQKVTLIPNSCILVQMDKQEKSDISRTKPTFTTSAIPLENSH